MRIDYATPQDIYDVAIDMREKDYAEFTALSHADTRAELAHGLVQRFAGSRDVICAHGDEYPIAIGATFEARPNVLTLMFFATLQFESVALPMTKFIRQRLFPSMMSAGVHRIEAVSSEWYLEAHRWIEALGLEREAGPMRGYGRNGESFIQFAWVSDVCKTRSGN